MQCNATLHEAKNQTSVFFNNSSYNRMLHDIKCGSD